MRAEVVSAPTRGPRPAHAVLGVHEIWLAVVFIAALAVMPAASVHAAGWSEHLEAVPWFGLVGVLVGVGLARSRLPQLPSLALGLALGFLLASLQYAWLLPVEPAPQRVVALAARVARWWGAAFSGAASTDNLLFAYSMGLLAWLIGFMAAWFAFRHFNPWWAIVPTGGALLLNLSYAQPELLPLVVVQLLVSFLLLMHLHTLGQVARWRAHSVEYGLNRGLFFVVASAALGGAIVFAAWGMPVGEVSRGVASTWENFAGPWQNVQANFDRLFASLNPSPQSSRGLMVTQTMAPRGSFELGDSPVMRITGREPAYWRAATFDRYTGRVMTNSGTASQRLDRGQPIEGSMQTDDGRKFVEYTVTLLAPASSVVYAPDRPITLSIPTIYDYRGTPIDYGSLRPVVPIREQQRYNVLTSVSTATMSELRQAGTIYPQWTRRYLELPPELPEAVRREGWKVVGDATNVYDASSNIEQYLRSFKYSTRVPVPPGDRDWVGFLLFESKEGYCDYYATAMTVMLRSVGIPARVVSGYVTGDWDPATQSYTVTERHAHTWTEVYFPNYGWITFEPSANRPGPVRLEKPLVALTEEELLRVLESETGLEDFLDEEELFDSGFVPLPTDAGQSAFSPGVVLLLALMVASVVGALTLGVLWFRGMAGLPPFARTYAQVVRLATWCGYGPRRSQTPYEYTRDLARVVPAAAEPLSALTEHYVAGTYGGRRFDGPVLRQLRSASGEARRVLFRALALQRARAWLRSRLRELASSDRR